MIESIGEVMRQSIVQQVRSTTFFSVLADETTDSGCKEQLSICVRYVHDEILHEEFLVFIEVTDLTGHGLGNTIYLFYFLFKNLLVDISILSKISHTNIKNWHGAAY